MSSVETARTVKGLIAEMLQLSEEEQRSLASAVLGERTLEAFVEELEDQLSCERAATQQAVAVIEAGKLKMLETV